MVKTITTVVLLSFLLPVYAAGTGFHLEHANNDVSNTPSLQRGAKYFVNYCLGCHSAKYVRYSRVAKDLGISEDQLIENLMFTAERPQETMDIVMPPKDAERWFGKTPPDLSLAARSRGTDFLYTFLKSFYLDDSTTTGVNNKVLNATSMPHVLWELQGFQRELYTGDIDDKGNVKKIFEGFELAIPGKQSPEEFDQTVRDVVNFLDYIGEPVQLERQRLGYRVMAFLLVFFIFAYLLKKEYWKDVH